MNTREIETLPDATVMRLLWLCGALSLALCFAVIAMAGPELFGSRGAVVGFAVQALLVVASWAKSLGPVWRKEQR